jgi:P27 family predicted phage terminase small subunit
MGKRGRKCLPTTLLIAHGSNAIYKRRNLDTEIKAPAGPLPECPTWLNDAARTIWFRLTPAMHKMGLLSDVDVEPFARYCDTLALWHKARTMIEKAGIIITIRADGREGDVGEDGKPTKLQGKIKSCQIAPWMTVYNRLTPMLHKMESEFGLTPSARAGMTKPGNENGSRNKNRFFGQAASAS